MKMVLKVKYKFSTYKRLEIVIMYILTIFTGNIRKTNTQMMLAHDSVTVRLKHNPQVRGKFIL